MKILTLGLAVLTILVVMALLPIAIAQEVPTHVAISEVYPDASDEHNSEWIELYNPTEEEVIIEGWTIDTATRLSDVTLPAGATIPSHGFYLIADGGFSTGRDNPTWPAADLEDEMSLRNGDGWCRLNNSGSIVDTVGWGTAITNETANAAKPAQGKSIERKSLNGGYGPCKGTNNNSIDFFVQGTPTPKNSASQEMDPPCTCGNICVNTTGWWRDGGNFNASGTPIQHAIDNAAAGETICVKDGTYNESVDVTKSHLTIRSENGSSVTTVSASLYPDKHVFDITDQTNVTLEGFEIRDATGTSQSVAGIYMENANDCNISGNIVTNISATGWFDGAYGIYLSSSSDNNSFVTTTVYNLSANDGDAYGIYLSSSSDNSFVTTTVYNLSANYNADGILLSSSSDNSFVTSTVYNLDARHEADGIRLDSSSDNSFVATTVYNLSSNHYAFGIRLYSSSGNSFHTSTTVYNLSSAGDVDGIELYELSNNNSFHTSTVYNLSADNHACGIELDSSSDNSFVTTTVYNLDGNSWANCILLGSSSGNNSFVTSTVYNLSSAHGRADGIDLWSSSDNSFVTSTVYNLDAKYAGGISLYSSIEKIREGKFSIKLPRERAFRAGLYKSGVELVKDERIYVVEKEFPWGVLAINTHKSIYLPNEAAFIGIAVLDNEGHMVCDADVTLTITDPSNKETVLSTGNGLIKVSPQCCVYGVTNLPDYYTNYTVGGAGTYVMNLTAVTADGTKSITDEFTVQNSVDFDVARDGATRIYPSVPYVMNFTIKANKDYDGLIKEYVPASFVITPQDGLIVTTVGDTKILTWNRNLVKGETYNIYYEFDAPDVSPYLFTLGALEIGSFKEDRQWQIANDDTVTYYFDDYDHVHEKWVHHPSYMVDGNTGTYAYCDKENGTQLLTSNNCTGTDLGTISKVEIRAYGYMEVAGDNVSLRPVFTAGDGDDHPNALNATSAEWGPYIDITTDTNASSPWTWSNVSNLDCDVVCHHAGHKFSYCAKVEINVTYADTIGPTVTIINPKNKTYNTRSLTLDASIGADAQSCWYSLNGGTNASFTCGTTVDITANEGSNNISVYANDTLENIGSDIVLFSVDTSIILDISITSPANGTITNDPTPTLTLLAIDKDYPTINYTLYIYNEDGTLYSVGNSGTLNNDTSTDIVLSPAITLEGDSTTYKIRATANDSASNSANSSDLYITLEPPWLDLIFPGYGYWDNDGNIPFTFKYGCPSYPRANCTLYINSIYNQHDDNTKVNTETTFDVTGLAEGKNQNWTINCTMNGASWISVEDTSIFHVDKTVPTITIDEPTTSSPVYRKGGEQFWVNFTYTELYPMFYIVEVGNSSDVINLTMSHLINFI